MQLHICRPLAFFQKKMSDGVTCCMQPWLDQEEALHALRSALAAQHRYIPVAIYRSSHVLSVERCTAHADMARRTALAMVRVALAFFQKERKKEKKKLVKGVHLNPLDPHLILPPLDPRLILHVYPYYLRMQYRRVLSLTITIASYLVDIWSS